MINYTFSAEGLENLPKLKNYCATKVVALEKYIPRKARESAKLDVHFSLEKASKGRDQKTCRLVLALPEDTLTVSERADHAYAALDIAAAELKRQLADYKTKHGKQALRHKIARALRGQKNAD